MNWFKYKLPDSDQIIAGASERLIKGLSDGFVFAPFLAPSESLFTIPFDFIPDEHEMRVETSEIPVSTTPTEHRHEVEEIIRSLNGKRGKTVAARAIRIDMHIDLPATFDALCLAYPESFTFAFSTQISGTWIGSTPELLLSAEDGHVRTMALAGTRSASDTGLWDKKNSEEQEMVTTFIKDTLARFFPEKSIAVWPPFTRKFGNVAHLCTRIEASSNSSELPIENILTTLSPTPAVCGSDREVSLNLIGRLEAFPREYYAGFCGPNNIEGKSEYYVMLRSAKCSSDALCLYAGGGITHLSDPDEEWNETEIKAKTIINNLKYKQ